MYERYPVGMDTEAPVFPPVVRALSYVVGLVAGAAGPVMVAFGLSDGWIALASGVAGVASAIALGYSYQYLQRTPKPDVLANAHALAGDDLLEQTDWSTVDDEQPADGTVSQDPHWTPGDAA